MSPFRPLIDLIRVRDHRQSVPNNFIRPSLQLEICNVAIKSRKFELKFLPDTQHTTGTVRQNGGLGFLLLLPFLPEYTFACYIASWLP